MEKLTVYLGVCFLLTIDSTSASCPDGWTRFAGSCYHFAHDKKTFTEAQHYCSQLEANLVTIETQNEQAFLRSHCSTLNLGPYWIGLTDADVEDIWKWIGSHEMPTYTDWFPGQPDDGTGGNCGALCIQTLCHFQWADRPCSLLYNPICELRDEGCVSVVG